MMCRRLGASVFVSAFSCPIMFVHVSCLLNVSIMMCFLCVCVFRSVCIGVLFIFLFSPLFFFVCVYRVLREVPKSNGSASGSMCKRTYKILHLSQRGVSGAEQTKTGFNVKIGEQLEDKQYNK